MEYDSFSDHSRALNEQVWAAFEHVRKPKRYIKALALPSFHNQEIEKFERIDWKNCDSETLKEFYEINCFIDDDAFIYLFPRVFDVCLQEPDEAKYLDFVECYFSGLLIMAQSGKLSLKPKAQRKMIFKSVCFLQQEMQFELFTEWPKKRAVFEAII